MASCLLPVLLLATVGESNLDLVYFTASWCQPCAQMQPTLERLQSEGVTIHVVDADQQQQAIRNYQIKDLPTLVFVSQGREVDRMVGVADYAQVKRRVERAWARTGAGIPAQTASAQPVSATRPATPNSKQPAPTGMVVRGQSPGPAASRQAVTAAHLAAASAAQPKIQNVASRSATATPSQRTPEQAIARAAAATVRIRVDEGNTTAHGTGTIVDVHGQEALVLTCGHLFRDMQAGSVISVDLFAGTPQEVNRPAQLVDFKAEETDIGLISFVLPVAVEPVDILPRGEKPQSGQSVFSFGCDHGADPTRRDTRITNINRYLGAANVEIQGAPAEGRSGGGLFDLQGRLIGVCNAADAQDDRGIYAGAEVVYAQIERLNLSHLFQNASASPSPSAPGSGAGVPAQMASHAPSARGATGPTVGASQPGLAGGWPDQRISPASLPPAAQPGGRPATATAGSAQSEVICILRDAKGERVVTIDNPSPELLQQLQAHR